MPAKPSTTRACPKNIGNGQTRPNNHLLRVSKKLVSLYITFNFFIFFISLHLPCGSFFTLVDVNGQQKWAKFLAKVENDWYSESVAGRDRSEYVPYAFVAMSGDVTQVKLELTNAMLCDWQVNLVLKRQPKAGGDKSCPYYNPSTQNKMLRTFYAHMKKEHGWQYTENSFKGWKGCVDGVLAEIYAQWLEKYVSSSMKNQSSIL